jgi:cytochrome c oxidase subunit 3
LIRTEIITADKQKQFFQEQSQKRLSQASFVVRELILQEMNMEVSYLLISSFLLLVSRFHVLSGVIINIIIFFNVLLGTYEKL